MRKLLLATTALVGFAVAGAAQAATSPINVTVGGSVDFLAGAYHESKSVAGSRATDREFETLYSLNFGITGKAVNGVEYGGSLVLDNAPDIDNAFDGNGNSLTVSTADIHMSGAFGKVVLGDTRGATDLALTAPTVGTGGVYGRYIDFIGADNIKALVVGVDSIDHSTNITYFTPKVGNETHKVQAGLTYAPKFYDYGSSVVHTKGTTSGVTNNSPYTDIVKGAVAYTGSFKPVTVGVSADIITGRADKTNTSSTFVGGAARDFTSYEIAATAAAQGFTVGVNYLDRGHYNTTATQTKDQHQFGAGVKYEFSKVTVGASYLGGKGYSNLEGTSGYVKDFDSYSVGGNYTWVPGMTTNVDGVLFNAKTDAGVKNDGYVLLVSQKLAF